MRLDIHYFNEIINIPADTTDLRLRLTDAFPINIEEIAKLPEGLRSLHINRVYPTALAALAKRCPDLQSLDLSPHGLPAGALAALAPLKHLRALGLTTSTKQLPDLSALPDLHTLRLYDASPSRADLAAIAAMPALRDLSFLGRLTRARDALVALKDTPTLTRLHATQLTDALSPAEIAALAALPSLSSVSLSVRDADDVRALAPLHDKVERLGLALWGGGTFGDASFAALADATPNLRALDISGAANPKNCPYSQLGIARLGELKRLEWLETGHLDKSLVPEHLKWLTELTSLQHLHISARALSAKLVDTLLGCAALHTLTLRYPKLSDASVKKLATMKLRRLCLLHAPVSDKGVVELAKIKTLESLDLRQSTGAVNDAGLAALATLPALRSLTIPTANAPHTFSTLAPLASTPALQSLYIPIRHLPGGLAALGGAPALRSIAVEAGHNAVLDAASAAALKTIPTLRQLSAFDLGHELMEGRVHVSRAIPHPPEPGGALADVC